MEIPQKDIPKGNSFSNYSPLRYPGGKGKLSYFIGSILEKNGLIGCDYAEPFCGGSAVAIHLLLRGYASRVHINDLDKTIFSFWHSVIHQTDDILRMIVDHEANVETWRKAKKIIKNYTEYSSVDLGWAAFFLNRVNRSGILTGGLIGGKDQNGPYKMDARYNLSDLVLRIERIARSANKVVVTNRDVVSFLNDFEKLELNKPFVYLDPPYYVKGHQLYMNFFRHDDHVRISDHLRHVGKYPWLVTYDNAKEILDLYPEFQKYVYNLNYAAGSQRTVGTEILICSRGLRV